MSKKYNEDQINVWIERYADKKEAGWKLKDIEEFFELTYDLKDISFIRKRYDMMKKTNKINIIQDEKTIEDIARAKSDLLVNRKINILMNKDLHKQANDNARWDMLVEKLQSWKPEKYTINEDITITTGTPKDVIYIVGDVHYRGRVDAPLIKGLFAQIKAEVIERGYQDVTLILTGDNIDGEIHEEQQRTNEPVIDQALQISDLYVDLINQIPNIKTIYMVYGNHEEIRLWGDKNTENNVGKFIYYNLKNRLLWAEVYAGRELIFNYKDRMVLLLHGHQNYAKNKARLIEHCAVEYQMQPDYIILGHFHTSKTNQFSRNHWLITAPAAKDWQSIWDSNNGYCGLGQYIKLKLNWQCPQITTVNITVK